MRKFDCERQAVNASDSDDSAELSPGTWPLLPTDAGHNHGAGRQRTRDLALNAGDEGPWPADGGTVILVLVTWRLPMTITYATSVKALCDALVVSREKLSATMRQVTDPSPRAVGTWTIGETAQHVSSSAE